MRENGSTLCLKVNNTRKERKFEHKEGYPQAVYSVPLYLPCSGNLKSTSITRLRGRYSSGPILSPPWLYAEADFVAIKKQEGVGRTKVVPDSYDHTHLNSDHKYT